MEKESKRKEKLRNKKGLGKERRAANEERSWRDKENKREMME